MILPLFNDRLRTLIPNIIHEVDGETPLADKLQPWLSSACQWLEENLLGDFQPENSLYALAEKIIVYKAFADAIPSLDVTLSPAGFAVLSTEGRAPASKERIERLISSLNSFVYANLPALSDNLLRNSEWTLSDLGQWYRATFIPSLSDVSGLSSDKDIFSAYKTIRSIALTFEHTLEEKYLGRDFLISVRSSFPTFERPGDKDIYHMIRDAELRFIRSSLSSQKDCCSRDHEIWHLTRPILAQLDYWPSLKSAWGSEMGEKVLSKPFKNSVRGGFFF